MFVLYMTLVKEYIRAYETDTPKYAQDTHRIRKNTHMDTHRIRTDTQMDTHGYARIRTR